MNGKPKIIVLFTLGLLIIYFIFDTLVIAGVSRSSKGQIGKVNKICNHDQLPELAIFGSSVGEVGINAPLIQKQTNLSAYNFSIDGTRFAQYKGLIEELSTNNNKTKLVILTEAYFSLTKVDKLTVLERYLANISNHNVYSSLHSIQPDIVWKCRYVPGYKYSTVSHSFYLAALDGWERYFRKNDFQTLSGYTPVHRDWESDQDSKIKKMKSFSIYVDSLIVEEYKNCILNLKSKGIDVIIVLPPIYSAFSKKLTDFTPLRDALNKVAKETNCIFLDFTNSKICDDKTFFYNSNHLNSKGSNIFSTILADSINCFRRHIEKN